MLGSIREMTVDVGNPREAQPSLLSREDETVRIGEGEFQLRLLLILSELHLPMGVLHLSCDQDPRLTTAQLGLQSLSGVLEWPQLAHE